MSKQLFFIEAQGFGRSHWNATANPPVAAQITMNMPVARTSILCCAIGVRLRRRSTTEFFAQHSVAIYRRLEA